MEPKQRKKDPGAEKGLSLRVKFVIHGEEMLEKVVMRSGNSGRVYLPPDWNHRLVKIIRMD